MNTFERHVQHFVQQEQLIVPGERLVVACSGGVDSMALLSFCLQLKEVEIVVAHVDHMLRGQQSYEDLLFVERFCQERGVRFVSTQIDIPTLYEQQGGNLQALCRQERYRFLAQAMKEVQATKLLTAHHADDQLESMLMSIVKSSSVTSLQGIRVRRPFQTGEIIRPFLMVTKAEIREYLQEKNISYREDASNAKDSYLRNRIRHHILPLLQQENVQVSKHAVQLSQQLAEDDYYLQQQANELFLNFVKKTAKLSYEIEIDAFNRTPVALQRRLVLILLNYIYSDANTFQSYSLCTAILNLMKSRDGSAEIHLPAQLVARRQYGKLMIGAIATSSPFEETALKLDKWYEFGSVRVYIGAASNIPTLNAGQSLYYFSKASVAFPLRIRARQHGDKLHCVGMTRPKKLSRIFIDDKIPLHARDEWPVLTDNNDEILALLGIRVSTIFSKHKRANDDYIVITERLYN